jgi:YD repeat-containing protein
MSSVNRDRFVGDRGSTARRRILSRPLVLSLALTLVLLAPASGWAQQANINYVYDDLNRLSAVVDQQGNVGTYSYDLLGNLLAVGRVNASSFPGPVAITLFTPLRALIGKPVTLFGKGFRTIPTDNVVTFNGTTAVVTAAEPNRLVTTVPAGATTGRIVVTNPDGTGTSAVDFTVGGVLAVSPITSTLYVSASQAFAATEGGTPTTAVAWSVNGVTGGAAVVGTITTGGVYTAPAQLPADTTVQITATQQGDRLSSASASAVVRVRPIGALVSPAVSIKVADSPARLIKSADVALTRAPVITGISPNQAAPGMVTLTLTGVGFAGAILNDLKFLLANMNDNNFTVTSLTVQPGGASATAQVTIAGGTSTGDRVVQITASGAPSTRAGLVGNVFKVLP